VPVAALALVPEWDRDSYAAVSAAKGTLELVSESAWESASASE
jgi:hypothetical protein